MVSLRGSTQVLVRDLTDFSHSITVSTLGLGAVQRPQFISAAELAYVDRPPGPDQERLVRVPLVGSPVTPVATACLGIIAFTWSPDGRTAAYLADVTDYKDYAASQLVLVTEGKNRVASVMPFLGGGCESMSCADGSDIRLSFSPDGHFISLVQSWGGPNFRLWTSDGKLLMSNEPGVGYRMSAWSGNSLYFVDDKGVAVWRGGVVSSFLPGVSWLRPKGSPLGGQIVYAARDRSGLAHTYLVDTATKRTRELKAGRAEPVFLTSRFIWYQGERLCVAADHCQSGWPVIASGKSYIYDLQDGTETESDITGVFDVWPHSA